MLLAKLVNLRLGPSQRDHSDSIGHSQQRSVAIRTLQAVDETPNVTCTNPAGLVVGPCNFG